MGENSGHCLGGGSWGKRQELFSGTSSGKSKYDFRFGDREKCELHCRESKMAREGFIKLRIRSAGVRDTLPRGFLRGKGLGGEGVGARGH